MPYIRKDQRRELDVLLNPLIERLKGEKTEEIDGELNYIVSRVLKDKYGTDFEVEPEEVENVFLKPETGEMRRGEFSAMMNGTKANKEKIIRFMCAMPM